MQKSRLLAARNVNNFSGLWNRGTGKAFDKSQQSGCADQSQQTGLVRRGPLTQQDVKNKVFERRWNSVRIISGTSNIQSFYTILVPPNAIINPKKHDIGSLTRSIVLTTRCPPAWPSRRASWAGRRSWGWALSGRPSRSGAILGSVGALGRGLLTGGVVERFFFFYSHTFASLDHSEDNVWNEYEWMNEWNESLLYTGSGLS